MSSLWEFLADEPNRLIISWLAGGIGIAATAIWTVLKFFHQKPGEKEQSLPSPRANQSIRAGRDAAGRDINRGISGIFLLLILAVIFAVALVLGGKYGSRIMEEISDTDTAELKQASLYFSCKGQNVDYPSLLSESEYDHVNEFAHRLEDAADKYIYVSVDIYRSCNACDCERYLSNLDEALPDDWTLYDNPDSNLTADPIVAELPEKHESYTDSLTIEVTEPLDLDGLAIEEIDTSSYDPTVDPIIVEVPEAYNSYTDSVVVEVIDPLSGKDLDEIDIEEIDSQITPQAPNYKNGFLYFPMSVEGRNEGWYDGQPEVITDGIEINSWLSDWAFMYNFFFPKSKHLSNSQYIRQQYGSEIYFNGVFVSRVDRGTGYSVFHLEPTELSPELTDQLACIRNGMPNTMWNRILYGC